MFRRNGSMVGFARQKSINTSSNQSMINQNLSLNVFVI
jgi:hypothetical protein